MTQKKASRDSLAVTRARALHGSPLGNLLLEDAAASKQHGRTSARVGVGPDGNPIVYSTDVATREAVVRAIQERAHVNFMDIPEVSEHDFRKLLRDGTHALDQPHALDAADVSEQQPEPEPKVAVEPTRGAHFVLRISDGGRIVASAGPFKRIMTAVEAMNERGDGGQVATIYDGASIAEYRGGRAVFTFGRTKWSRADG
jgi:hypothetical protein